MIDAANLDRIRARINRLADEGKITRARDGNRNGGDACGSVAKQ